MRAPLAARFATAAGASSPDRVGLGPPPRRRDPRVVRDGRPLGRAGADPRREPRRRRLGGTRSRARDPLRAARRRRRRGHRVLAAALASVWGFRLGGYLLLQPRPREGGGRALPGAPRGNGARTRTGTSSSSSRRRRCSSSSSRCRSPSSRSDLESGFGVVAWIGDRALGDRQRRHDRLRPPARALAREPGEHGQDGARRPVELVAPPELLLRVGELVRQRARRDDRTLGLDRVGRTRRSPLLLFRVTGIPATEAQALRSRADYAEYQRTTSVFVPLPPRAQLG